MAFLTLAGRMGLAGVPARCLDGVHPRGARHPALHSSPRRASSRGGRAFPSGCTSGPWRRDVRSAVAQLGFTVTMMAHQAWVMARCHRADAGAALHHAPTPPRMEGDGDRGPADPVDGIGVPSGDGRRTGAGCGPRRRPRPAPRLPGPVADAHRGALGAGPHHRPGCESSDPGQSHWRRCPRRMRDSFVSSPGAPGATSPRM